MKTKLFFQALILITATASLSAQTVVWERKAFGQPQAHPCGGTFNWPNNNFWGQEQRIRTECNQAFVAEPSNWSTLTYPNGAGVDVILGAGGAPGTQLVGLNITLNSLTIQSVGALNISFGSTLTANTFVFEGDGVLENAGGGGIDPILTINPGGSMTKTGGAGSYTMALNIRLVSTNATISSLAGTLVLPGNSSRQTNPIFNAAANASVVLAPAGGFQLLSGNVQSTGAGTILHNAGRLFAGEGGAELNFPDGSFQWSGGTLETDRPERPLVNKGTINLTGPGGLVGIFTNSGVILQSGAGTLNVPSGSVFTNSAPGLYDITNDNGITAAGGGGPNPTFQNAGHLAKTAGTGTSEFAVGLFVNNSGTIDALSGTLKFWIFKQSAGTTFLGGGNLAFINEATFDGGSLTGTGTITGHVRNDGATISPGLSPGRIIVNGNYAQGANGILNMEIGGTAPGTEYDQLQVNGTATLGGTLNVTLINGFRPTVGQVFQLIAPNTFAGAFATINTVGFTANVTYSNSGITLTVATVPDIPLNISTRMHVGTDPNQLIGGFIVTGTEPKKVIILATGPSLAAFGLQGVLADPVLELFQGNTLVASNDNWKTPAQAEIEATQLQPSHDLESALVQTLAPGAYTAVVRGTNGTGVGTVQIYDLASTSKSKLANLSSRGFVQPGDDKVMIAGFIIGGNGGANSRVVVRALGPSLSAFGIAQVIPDPTLTLKDANGSTLLSNDDWQQAAAAAEISSRGLAPGAPEESALAISLSQGGYTAIVRGKGEASGVAVVEVYNVP